MKLILTTVTLSFLLIAGATGCQDEGPAERAGRQIDETVEEATGGAEGALERFGREVDEAVEETQEAVEEVGEAAREAGR